MYVMVQSFTLITLHVLFMEDYSGLTDLEIYSAQNAMLSYTKCSNCANATIPQADTDAVRYAFCSEHCRLEWLCS